MALSNVGVFPPEELATVAPPRTREESGGIDASKLTYPLAVVVLIVSVAGAFYGLSARLDVISVKIDAQKEVQAEQAKVRAMELEALKVSIEVLRMGLEDVRKRQDLFNERQTAVSRQR